jgi:hypothetical protein
MAMEKDFRDLFALFNAHNVEYMIIGGYALVFTVLPIIQAIWIFM